MGGPPAPDAPSAADGTQLTGLAVAAVAARLAGHRLPGAPPRSPTLLAAGTTFVSLHNRGTLRGCIGSLQPVRPLYRDVIRNAVRAAADPRLPPVTATDWPDLDFSVAVLSAPEDVPAGSRAALLAALRPGIHGLTLSQGSRRVTFLPAVWEKLPDPEQFLGALLVKGGWSARAWPGGLTASRYTAVEFHDHSPRPTPPPIMNPGS
jgi:AmmeMemoRadiSam system protein A